VLTLRCVRIDNAVIGKPEPLKGDLSGYWSRRIDDEHRLVYRADDKEVKILKARYHYRDCPPTLPATERTGQGQ
jgi:Txe/YoeB family toxin of Txe-Axe toxin-antitoxin module